MSLRKLVTVVPVIAALSLAAPVASASAQTPAPGVIPCYPYPAFCGPNGQSWTSFFFSQLQIPGLQIPGLQLPSLPGSGIQFGPGPVQLPTG